MSEPPDRESWRLIGAMKCLAAEFKTEIAKERQLVRRTHAVQDSAKIRHLEEEVTRLTKERDGWRDRHRVLEKKLARLVEALDKDPS